MDGMKIICADCGEAVGKKGPPDGWQLEDRTVCHECCVVDTKKVVQEIITQARNIDINVDAV